MQKRPEIIVFAGPNGSGKSTITKMANIIEPYVNADDIKKTNYCTDIEAAQMVDKMRNELVSKHMSFTFETVLSTDRNLKLLEKANSRFNWYIKIYIIQKCFYNQQRFLVTF